jgi:nucleoside recognition membrane protein YjiH
MSSSSFRSLAVGVLVVGGSVLALVAPAALQYEHGAAAFAVLAAAHFTLVVIAARLASTGRRSAPPRVDFVRATA